ncbi:MAG: hypothetical protein AAGA88_03405 [Pseudomonadota bacterium]
MDPSGAGSNQIAEVFEELERWEACLHHLELGDVCDGPEVGP